MNKLIELTECQRAILVTALAIMQSTGVDCVCGYADELEELLALLVS